MKNNNRKSERIGFRTTPEEKKKYTDAAKSNGMKLSEYISYTLATPTPSILTHEDFISSCVTTNIIFNELRAYNKLTTKDVQYLERIVESYVTTH